MIGLAVSHVAWGSGTVCVNTNTELALALDDAQGTATTIEVVQGTYDLKSSVWNASGPQSAKFHDGSSLLGGYTANCAGRNIDVGNTTLTNTGSASPEIVALGDATIEGVSFNLIDGFSITTHGNKSGSEVLFRRDVFTGAKQNQAEALSVEWNDDAATSGTVRVVDCLVHDNSDLSHGGFGAITFYHEAGAPKFELVNNTVVNNGGTMQGVAVETSTAVDVYAYNNIFYGNAGLDLYVQAGDATVLADNDIGSYFIPHPSTAPVGTLGGDPKLDSNFKPIESPASPVINAGTDDVIGGLPSTDLPGRDREIGSEPDLGAYESSVNDSGSQTVTTTSDSGLGSLRTAIAGANANGTAGATIKFNIPNACPHVITLATTLPAITAPVHIEGFTQPGSSANTLSIGDNTTTCIVLDGATHSIDDGLVVNSNAPATAKLNVSGIAFSGFTHSAVNIRGASKHVVTGIRTGGSVGTQALAAVAYGVIIGPDVTNTTIGGDDPSDRNILGGAMDDAVHIDGESGSSGAANNNQVIGNYIGVKYVGTTASSNANGGDGISIAGFSNTVRTNLIGFSTYGIHLTNPLAAQNFINENQIGFTLTETVVPNGIGIYAEGGAGLNDLSDNVISHSTNAGAAIVDSSFGNDLRGTVFYANGGLAIDLGNDGVTLDDNDAQNSAGQPNRKQNFPLIQTAIGEARKGTIAGYLVSTPGDYTIQAFASESCDASGYGEGEYPIGEQAITIPDSILVQGQSVGDFSITGSAPFAFGYSSVSVTATDSTGNTSEFSQCMNYTNDQIFGNGFELSITL
ncbi:MAG TPA: choice-of-anchor Q domain-containing protein [Rudaea sp.]|nr:choice-of-anchor Q domain-containing protein [Rudaea sp.]